MKKPDESTRDDRCSPVQYTATYNGAMSISPWLVLVIGFVLGSIPFGVLMGKLRGVDLQATGSGNIGATNAIRSMGKGPGIIVFILDALKGALPVLIAKAAHTEPSWFVYAGLLAIVGHIFSPWVRFKGGKGAATGLGVLFGLDLPLALGTFVLFILTFVISGKRVSVGSMIAALGQAGAREGRADEARAAADDDARRASAGLFHGPVRRRGTLHLPPRIVGGAGAPPEALRARTGRGGRRPAGCRRPRPPSVPAGPPGSSCGSSARAAPGR